MSERDDMESTIRDRDSEIKALARDRDVLASRLAAVEALAADLERIYGRELVPPMVGGAPVWRVLRAALASVPDADTQRESEGDRL